MNTLYPYKTKTPPRAGFWFPSGKWQIVFARRFDTFFSIKKIAYKKITTGESLI
jgi:hypothetical protein